MWNVMLVLLYINPKFHFSWWAWFVYIHEKHKREFSKNYKTFFIWSFQFWHLFVIRELSNGFNFYPYLSSRVNGIWTKLLRVLKGFKINDRMSRKRWHFFPPLFLGQTWKGQLLVCWIPMLTIFGHLLGKVQVCFFSQYGISF